MAKEKESERPMESLFPGCKVEESELRIRINEIRDGSSPIQIRVDCEATGLSRTFLKEGNSDLVSFCKKHPVREPVATKGEYKIKKAK